MIGNAAPPWMLAFARTLGLLAFCLGACATGLAPNGVQRPSFTEFSRVDLTQNEILKRLGEPSSRGQTLRHGQPITGLHYSSLSGDRMSRVRYRKECWFFFQGEKYLGYRFVSGLPEEQINFDDEKVTQIVKGKTTQQEILVMFGEPNGVLRFPATPEPTDPAPTTAGDSLYDYNFRLFTLGGSRFENKDLRVIFDPTGVVKDVRFTANTKGQKFRQGAFTPEL